MVQLVLIRALGSDSRLSPGLERQSGKVRFKKKKKHTKTVCGCVGVEKGWLRD